MKLDRTSMLYGTLILTGTSIVSQFLGFVYRILLSRLIGAEVMGLYQLIMPVFSVIMALTAVGLTVAVSNLSSQYHARGNRAAIAQVLRRCLAVFLLLFAAVAAVVVLLYDPISVYLLGDARTQLGLLLLLPCILLTGVENLHKHFFYGTGNIRPPAAVELCEQFIRTGAVLGLLVVFLPQNPEKETVQHFPHGFFFLLYGHRTSFIHRQADHRTERPGSGCIVPEYPRCRGCPAGRC